jgi:hypothetical protein
MAAKKTKKRGGAKKSGPKSSGIAKTAEELQKARNKVVNLVVDQSEEMAERVVRSVSERGNLSTLKFLWEIAGMFPAASSNDEEDDSGMSALEKFGLCGDVSEEDSAAEVESSEP